MSNTDTLARLIEKRLAGTVKDYTDQVVKVIHLHGDSYRVNVWGKVRSKWTDLPLNIIAHSFFVRFSTEVGIKSSNPRLPE